MKNKNYNLPLNIILDKNSKSVINEFFYLVSSIILLNLL